MQLRKLRNGPQTERGRDKGKNEQDRKTDEGDRRQNRERDAVVGAIATVMRAVNYVIP